MEKKTPRNEEELRNETNRITKTGIKMIILDKVLYTPMAVKTGHTSNKELPTIMTTNSTGRTRVDGFHPESVRITFHRRNSRRNFPPRYTNTTTETSCGNEIEELQRRLNLLEAKDQTPKELCNTK